MSIPAKSSPPQATNGAKIAKDQIPMGVVGLGLMGTSIATCLLAAGHPVVGVESDPGKRASASRRVLASLKEMRAEGLLKTEIGRASCRERV